MAALSLAETKSYLRVTDNSEDTLITALMAAASEFILQCTGKSKAVVGTTETAISEDGLYKQAVLILVAHWFENRGEQLPQTLNEVNYAVKAIINHISLCGVYV